MPDRRELLGLLAGLPFVPVDRALAQALAAPAEPPLIAPETTAGAPLSAPKVGLAPVSALASGQALRALPRLVNTSTQPGWFRASLTAASTPIALLPGTPTPCWTYNGQFPGPMIEVTEGDTVEIVFTNQLDQPSTLEWHGLPIPVDPAGHPYDAVAPGGQRTYRFTLPEGCAGTYWYHPQAIGHTAEQVFRGLTGAFVVRARVDPLADLPERVLLFTDLKLLDNGHIANNDARDLLNGREGQFALVNGQRQPTLSFHPGGRERWRLINANSARYLRLNLSGLPFTLVGTDGGLLEQPQTGQDEWLLAPAQRLELVVDAPARGGSVGLWAAPYQRGKLANPRPELPLRLLQVQFAATQAPAPTPLSDTLRSMAALGSPVVKQKVVISDETSVADGVQRIHFLLNGKRFLSSRIDLTSRVGQVELWEILNTSEMDLPFHLQGGWFEVQDSLLDGKLTPAPFRARQDTLNLRPGERVRLKMLHTHKGSRLYYGCILEHQDAGMMGQLLVV